ncbi:hypothetical protein [Paraherbaspirillum soli]|uniref:Cucumopine synthase C-terminal helical bundle domain-containing protein n=1 Tax=Paraherbaspirillum soli TaxID=631222 RepID=A0ABW0MC83_9BURK
MRKIDITWVSLDITVTAVLERDKNPQLADLLWDKLPYNSLQNHALVSGHHLYHLAPFPELLYTAAAFKEDRTKSVDGTLFLSQLQHLAIKYGPLSEYIPAAPVGHVIPEHLPLLREAGRACWKAAHETKQVIEVRVSHHGTKRGDFSLRWEPATGAPHVKQLIHAIRAATELIWIRPPQEVLNIHSGQITSRAGSYEQYLSTMVFVNGETRPLGYNALNGLVRLCENKDISLETLRIVTPNFIKTPAEFLGYCGLDDLWSFTQEVLAILPHLKTREEYFSLISALALYANCLNTWNLHYFPWQLGNQFGYQRVPGNADLARA